MATLLRSPAVSKPHSVPVLTPEPCWQCGQLIPSDHKSDPHLCPGCLELGRNSAVHNAFATVNAITRGDGPLFKGLDDADKLELLAEIMAAASNDQLIALAAAVSDTIAARLGSVDEPSPAERQRIEDEAQDDPDPDGILARRVYVH